MNSSLGLVKAWWTAVHAPAPTATSPLATASELGSNKGASTTQVKANASSSIRPWRWPISRRAAPSSPRLGLAAPAAKKTQSPGFADVGGDALALGVGDVLGHRTGDLGGA